MKAIAVAALASVTLALTTPAFAEYRGTAEALLSDRAPSSLSRKLRLDATKAANDEASKCNTCRASELVI